MGQVRCDCLVYYEQALSSPLVKVLRQGKDEKQVSAALGNVRPDHAGYSSGEKAI